MSNRIRSIIGNKIIQAVKTYTESNLEINASQIFPHIKVNGRSALDLTFVLPSQKLIDVGILDNKKDIEKNLSSLISTIDLDCTVYGAFFSRTKKDFNINFKVTPHYIGTKTVQNILSKPKSFWRDSELISSILPEKVIVEFSSPNIAKPFHVGHLRSTVIGNFVANLCEACGHNVTRINFLGDWGTQFGLLKYGYNSKGMHEDDLEPNSIKKLYEIYVEVNQKAENKPDIYKAAQDIFLKMEEGNEKEIKDWKFFCDISLKEYDKFYKKFNVSFDHVHGESMYKSEKCVSVVDKMNIHKILATLEDGRKVYKIPSNRFVTVCKSDGSCLYITRDLAAAIDRQEMFKFDKMYYVVDNSQTHHFCNLFSIISDLKYNWSTGLRHIKFGRVLGMSTRKGMTVFLEDLLADAEAVMKKNQEQSPTTKKSIFGQKNETAEKVAISALIVHDLRQRRQKDYNFTWHSALQSNGDTGVQIQYCHCRLVSLQKNCGISFDPKVDVSFLKESVAVDIIRELIRYDEVLFHSYQELESCILVNYLFRLCSVINVGLKVLNVKDAELEMAKSRLALFVAARHALAAGMKVLGLKPLEEM